MTIEKALKQVENIILSHHDNGVTTPTLCVVDGSIRLYQHWKVPDGVIKIMELGSADLRGGPTNATWDKLEQRLQDLIKTGVL